MTSASRLILSLMCHSFHLVISTSSLARMSFRCSLSRPRCLKMQAALLASGQSEMKLQPHEDSMADLLDIAPSTSVVVVKIDGYRVTVRGISLDAIAAIVARFPGLKSLASGLGDGEDIIMRLIEACGIAAAPIIAAGCGHLGDAKYERFAAQLLPEHQVKFLR